VIGGQFSAGGDTCAQLVRLTDVVGAVGHGRRREERPAVRRAKAGSCSRPTLPSTRATLRRHGSTLK
jgi:hypothetical protein